MITKNEKEKGDVKARVSDDPTKINQKSQKRGGGGRNMLGYVLVFTDFIWISVHNDLQLLHPKS